MTLLKLFVFGSPRLEREGQLVELNLRKALALLVYLAVTGQPQSRDALATLLWPESDGREGRARLRRTLHRLTQEFEGLLVADADTIRLRTADLWLDSAIFRQHVAAGLPAAPANALAPERLAHLTTAIELYTDDFLAGFTLPDSPTFDEWQFFVRENLRQLYGQALEQLVQAHRTTQAWEQAILYARKWVALDRLHEPAHRMLMRLYAWSGQQAAALRQYQECARVLDAELGVTPEDETTAVYEAIRTRQFGPPEATDSIPGPSSEVHELAPHQRYVLEEWVADGGQGEVYRGRDRLTGQPVAIKWLKSELADQPPDLVARFVREGTALRRLNHPNIVGILDTFEHAGRYAIVMEYVPGGSLRGLLDTVRLVPLDQALAIGLELADALSRAHHLGIIHRDLKPENVLLAADGTPRLTDFGMARLEQDDMRLTQSGTAFGSPAYMSPEAVRGEELDARSDIWSLGVLLYELLAGRRPFDGAQVTPVLASILQDATPDLRQFRPDVPRPMVDLLSQMLVKERPQRIASIRQVAAALEAIRDGRAAEGLLTQQPGVAPALTEGTPVTPPSQVAYTPSRQRTLSASRPMEQRIRFCMSPDGTRIAYATAGTGPPLVKVPNWMSHLEFDWQSPVWRHWWTELSGHYTLIRSDLRGCGLSDWNVQEMSIERRLQDLERVIDALELDRFPLLALSGGGPTAIAYAVRHPQKVSQLVLYGSYARGRLNRDFSPEQREEVETFRRVIEIGWGKANPAFRQVYTTLFIPDGTPEQLDWFNDLQRLSTSPEIAVRIAMSDWSADVSDLASQVAVPTLVLHAQGDAVVPFEEGRRLAALIPGAQFVPLESKNHILLENEPAWQRFLDEVYRFFGEQAAGQSSASDPASVESPDHRLLSPAIPMSSPPEPAVEHRSTEERAESVWGERHTPYNLPAELTPFIGRQQELIDVRGLLLGEPACRMLTLVGPGGIGKTRLALAAASAVRDAFPQGVYFVPLAPLTSVDYIVPAIAESLDFRFYEASDPQQQLQNYLREKQLLMVLDNFEHVLEGAGLVADILAVAPQVRILLTSRERLNLSGEVIYPLGGMAVPERASNQQALEYGAVQLLIQQARLARHDLDLRAYDFNAIVRICRLVQGMPLALVLAAGWLEVLSFREIADEITQSLDFLESQARDMPERQRSVRATFDYSWNRLPPEEQQTFIRLSVFRGGFTRQAAQSVASAELRVLRTLANKSLISVGREDRYEIHELLRQYAEEQLKFSGETDRARDAHSSYYLDALRQREADLKGRRQREALDEIELDLENIRVAWNWALRRRDLTAVDRAIESLHIFFDLHTRHQEGAEWFRLAREALAPPPGEEPALVWGRVLARLGALLSLGSEVYEAAATDVEQSLALAEKHDDLAEVAFCLFVLGKHVARGRRDFAGAIRLFERSLGYYRTLGDHYYAAIVLLWLGYCHGNATNLDNFHTFLHQSLDLTVATGNKAVAANVLSNLATGAFCAGNYAVAERYCREGRMLATEMDLRISIAHTHAQLSLAHLLRGDMDQVSTLAEEALALARDIQYTTTIAYALALLGLRAAIASDYALAERLCQESLSISSTAFGQILAHWGLAIASCGLQQHEAAWRQSRAVLERAQRFCYPAMMTWPLPIVVVLLGREGQAEQAVELLALAYTHSLSPTGWMRHWLLLAELRAKLLTNLDADVFQAAWKRGEALDATTVAAHLLARSDDNGDC